MRGGGIAILVLGAIVTTIGFFYDLFVQFDNGPFMRGIPNLFIGIVILSLGIILVALSELLKNIKELNPSLKNKASDIQRTPEEWMQKYSIKIDSVTGKYCYGQQKFSTLEEAMNYVKGLGPA